MKKNIMSCVLAVLAILSTAVAQDTLSADVLKSSYLYSQWPDFRGECILMNSLNFDTRNGYPTGKLVELEEDDSITVYGVAVGIDTWELMIVQSPIWDEESGDIVGYYDDSTYYYERLNTMCDTSAYEEAYELYALYKRDADSVVRVSPQLPVNIKLQQPSYVLRFNSYEDGSCTEHTRPLNVYEKYFNTPVEMTESFYVGMTHRMKGMGSECGRSFYTWPSFLRLLAPGDQPIIWEGLFYYETESVDAWGVTHPAGWVFSQIPLTFLFPIIAPPDSGYVWDTTVVAGDTVFAAGDTIVIGANDTIIAAGDTTVIVGGDTVFVAGGSAIVTDTTIISDTVIVQDTAVVGGDTIVYFDTIIHSDTVVTYDVLLSINEADMLGRLTVVKPNPATGTARVISSIGMSRVEACNMAGKRVLDRPVVGMGQSTTLDVSSWPAGTYILRIHTPMGTALKKLTVAR